MTYSRCDSRLRQDGWRLSRYKRLLIAVTFRFGWRQNGISRLNRARGQKIDVTHLAFDFKWLQEIRATDIND
jgi:hypothetical protein